VKSIQGLEEKRDLAFLYKRGQQLNREKLEEEGMIDKEEENIEREISQQILTTYIQDIAHALNGFCANHL
jgi:hypothetical protein